MTKPVLMLIQDLDVRVIDAATGELLGELTIDPTRDYQSKTGGFEPVRSGSKIP